MARVVLNASEIAALASDPGVSRGVADAAGQVANRARQLAPRRTGALANSIGVTVERDSRGAVAHVGSPLEYARYQELGTSKMSAHPFLRPALDGPVNV